jgi:hypothetical protein
MQDLVSQFEGFRCFRFSATQATAASQDSTNTAPISSSPSGIGFGTGSCIRVNPVLASSSSSSSSSANGHNNGNHNRFTDGPANEYLLALLSIEISLKNIDVVNRIISVVQLPMEFIHLYVSNCISSCENISNHYMQVYMS